MKDKYLEVTFRKGKPIAAYLYLPRDSGEKSQRTEKAGEGILIDCGKSNRPIGIEITAPHRARLETINRILAELNVQPMQKEEFAPLSAALISSKLASEDCKYNNEPSLPFSNRQAKCQCRDRRNVEGT